MTTLRMIGYRRVSTTEQERSGLGLAAQADAINVACTAHAWELADGRMYTEALSGGSMDRPELVAALAELKAGRADGLIVSRVDRLSRSMIDFCGIVDRARNEGWKLVALDIGIDMSTPAGEMVANVMASVAAYERQLISARIHEAFRTKAMSGQRLRHKSFQPPMTTMTRAWKLRATGHTYLQIADIFARDGLRNMSGEPWSQWQLASMLRPRRRSKYEQYFTDEHPDVIRARHARPTSLDDPSPEVRFTQLTLRQKELINVLQRHHGSVTSAARRLGVTERNLYRRIELIRRDMGVANYAELIEARRRALEREKAKRWQASRRAQLLAHVDAGDPTAIAMRAKELNRLAALQVRRRADWQRKVGELATAKHDGPPSAV